MTFFTRESCEDEDSILSFSSNSFEHVPNPYEFLKDSFSKLKVGGKMYVEVPNSLWSLENSFFPEFPPQTYGLFLDTRMHSKKLYQCFLTLKLNTLNNFKAILDFHLSYRSAYKKNHADNKFEEKMDSFRY